MTIKNFKFPRGERTLDLGQWQTWGSEGNRNDWVAPVKVHRFDGVTLRVWTIFYGLRGGLLRSGRSSVST